MSTGIEFMKSAIEVLKSEEDPASQNNTNLLLDNLSEPPLNMSEIEKYTAHTIRYHDEILVRMK